jgi:xyloglucan-specific exo-beta-1,4-glucanase
MSRSVQGIASRTLLSITIIVALTQVHALAQTYTWRNVQIVGGGFIVGVVFNQSEANLVYTRRTSAARIDSTTQPAVGCRC